MRINLFFRAAVAAFVLAAACMTASAQVGTVTGKVTLKQADGTQVPVEGAQIDIYRTDVKQEFHIKTNKKGEFVHAAIPLTGTFIFAASAPGARPTYFSGVRPGAAPSINFALEPGDGSRLTFEQMKAGASSGPAPAAASGKESADDKAKREEFEKEKARIEESNKKTIATNTIVKEAFDTGNKAFSEKRYDEAVVAYDRGLAADPTQAVLHLNRSLALRLRAVDKYNTAVKAKDNAARDAAKADFAASAEGAEKGVKFYREQTAKNAGGSAPGPNAQQASEMLNYLSARYESYRIALQTNSGATPDQAVTAVEEYLAAETDPAKKAKAQASLGEALFMSGKIDEAIASHRKVLASNPDNLEAMYGLGLALAAKVVDAEKDAPIIKESRDLLQRFIDKAPDTHPRKQEAIASVQYLDETMKAAAAPKTAPKTDTGRRRRP